MSSSDAIDQWSDFVKNIIVENLATDADRRVMKDFHEHIERKRAEKDTVNIPLGDI